MLDVLALRDRLVRARRRWVVVGLVLNKPVEQKLHVALQLTRPFVLGDVIGSAPKHTTERPPIQTSDEVGAWNVRALVLHVGVVVFSLVGRGATVGFVATVQLGV